MTHINFVVKKLFEKMRINNRMRKAVNYRGWVNLMSTLPGSTGERQGYQTVRRNSISFGSECHALVPA